MLVRWGTRMKSTVIQDPEFMGSFSSRSLQPYRWYPAIMPLAVHVHELLTGDSPQVAFHDDA